MSATALTVFRHHAVLVTIIENLPPISISAFLFATGSFSLVQSKLHEYMNIKRELQFLRDSPSLGKWISRMEELGDTIVLAGKDLEILVAVYKRPGSFWRNNSNKIFRLWIMSIGATRCLRPSGEMCLDINGDAHTEMPFRTCYLEDTSGCNGRICKQRIPMGMIMGPGPDAWPQCYNRYLTKWVTISTSADMFELRYSENSENGQGQSLDFLIEDWETTHTVAESLPYVVLTRGVIEVSEPVEAGDMDDALSARDVILDAGLQNECTIVLTHMADRHVWMWILKLGPLSDYQHPV